MKTFLAVATLTLLCCACNPQQTPPPGQPAAPAAQTPASSASTAGAPVAAPYKIVNWGQQSTAAGQPFNVQRDGNSGVTFELNQPAPAGEIRGTFDGKPLTGVVANGVIVTATIPGDYLAKPGRYPVALNIPTAADPVVAGEFEVK